MESSRRVGLPPAYEDADIDALCQLIGTYCETKPIICSGQGTSHSHLYETALMLDRLISINDRIPLSPYVTLLSLVLGRIPDCRSFFVGLYFFSPLFGGCGRIYNSDPIINRMLFQREHLAFSLCICTAHLHPRVPQAYRTLHQSRGVSCLFLPSLSTHYYPPCPLSYPPS